MEDEGTMPIQPSYLSPWNSTGDWSMSYQSGGGYAPNMNDPQYDPNYYTGPKRGTMEDPEYQRYLDDRRWQEDQNKFMTGVGPSGMQYFPGTVKAMNWARMSGQAGPSGGSVGGSSSGGGGGGGGSAAAQAALDRRFQMDLERMKLAQLDAQNKWNAKMQGFGSDLSLRNNLYGIAAQQPTSAQVGNALQIIGGDSARAFQPPVNPIGPAKGAMDYFPQGEQQQPPRAPAYTTWRR